MKTFNLNLRKIARGKFCDRNTGRMCVMGQLLNTKLGVPKDILSDDSINIDMLYNQNNILVNIAREIEYTNDSHEAWDKKINKIRPRLRKLGYRLKVTK